jgi:hypothetical protein
MSNPVSFTGTTNVPPITFDTGTGFQSPSGPAILAGVEADINAAFGGDLDFNLNTPQGQLASSWAAIVYNAYQAMVYMANQFDPNNATGRFQDAIAQIYFLQRNPAIPTALQIQCNGLNGVTIPVGALVVDPAGNLYSATGSGVIGVGGTAVVEFAALVPGPIAVPETISIYQSIVGWDSVVVLSGAEGQNIEDRFDFELRREASVEGNSFGAIGSILGAVATVPNVIDFYGYDNSTGSATVVGGVNIAASTIYICVAGGTVQAVAQAIFSKKSGGCGYTGNTVVTVYDSNPLYAAPQAYTVTYDVPSNLYVLFSVNIVNGPTVPANATTLVQNALLNAFLGQVENIPRARINSTLYATGYVQAINALGSWAQVASINIGSANTSTATVTGSIGATGLFNVTSVQSGTVNTGQFLFGTAGGTGAINIGTMITAFVSGTNGGVGVYQTNQLSSSPPQSIALVTANQTKVVVQANQEPLLVTPLITVAAV